MDKTIYLLKKELYHYPDGDEVFSPSIPFPEYPFATEDLSQGKNEIYNMVREALIGMGLDEENFGSGRWNPLGAFIKSGDTVVIKPNLVRDYETQAEYDCTLTHPSVVRAMTDYCIVAGAKHIIIGDAPVQGADMNKIYHDCCYDKIIDFYRKKKLWVEFKDFRDLIVRSENGIIKTEKKSGAEADELVTVSLGKRSKHYTDGKHTEYGTCGYPEKRINETHQENRHDYVISRYILEADVIINIPKPKTHRFAGITGAQKNFVGTCSDKESLPHFTAGAKCIGGDETNKNTILSKIIAKVYRKYLWGCRLEKYNQARIWYFLYRIFCKMKSPSLFIHGAWYGNDTIWRTIIDLNKIVLYGKPDGSLDVSKIQRTVFTVGDMIIAGEEEGPLHPSPKPLGVLLMSKNCAVFDAVFCMMTGFDREYIPTVLHSMKNTRLCPFKEEETQLFSNLEEFNKVALTEVIFPKEYHFKPHPFWKDIL